MRSKIAAFARNWLRDNRGTSLIEFGVALPFLALACLGVIEIGRYTAFALLVGNAARAGAQIGAVSQTNAQAPPDSGQPNSGLDAMPSQAACNDAYQSLSSVKSFSCKSSNSGPITICPSASGTTPTNGLLVNTCLTCTWSDGSTNSGCATPAPSASVTRIVYVTVSVQGIFTSLMKYPGVPNNVPISAQTTVESGP